ncbi:MAG: hypothetical protein ABIW76_24160 [Fibrobacteria bacterium]
MIKRHPIKPNRIPNLFFAAALILATFEASLSAPIIHPVTGSAGSRLPEAASAILGASGGTHVVEFSAYTNVGTFFLEGGTADTIIFRRKDPVVQSLPLTASALVTFKSFPGTVVFQGLSFRADAKTSWLLNGSETGKANGNLIFDSCQIFTTDSLNSANLITWLGGANSRIQFKRSFLVAKLGQSGMDLLADTISLDHNVINANLNLTANIRKFLSLSGNSLIRAQITSVGQPPGSSTATVLVRDNLFLHPVGTHSGALNLLLMGDVAVDSLKNNARDPSYTKFDQGSYNASFSSGNGNITFSGDKKEPSELWNWDITGETTKGAYNPAGSKAIPRYNLFPGTALFSKRLSPKDSVRITIDTAELPRLLDAAYDTGSPYPSLVDSVRTLWTKDTALAFSGPASISSIEFPLATSMGVPILFSNVASVFVAGLNGTEGGVLFTNGSATAKSFIPGFGSQNTIKGTAVKVKGTTADTTLVFASITRSGRTWFLANPLASSNKRWRVIQASAKPFGFRDSTNAEGSGTIQFGFSKTNADAPFNKDSLVFWLGNTSFSPVTDSAGKYWGKTNFTSDVRSLLIERLALGQGRDTVSIPQGKLISSSVGGHQLTIDSSFAPTQALFPDMGNFGKGLSFTWPGRAAGDTLYLELRKTAPKQRAFLFSGGKAVEVTPIKEDSVSLTIAFGTGDSGKALFLARRYTIPAGIKTTLALGKDSVSDLLSNAPGEYQLDTSLSTTGLVLDTFRVWAKRRVVTENLTLQSGYTIWVDAPPPIKAERVSAFILTGAKWDTTVFKRDANRYKVTVPAQVSGIVIAEKLEPIDTLPIFPLSKPLVTVLSGNLTLKPTLSTDEKTRLQAFHVDVVFLDPQGVLTKKSFETTSSDSGVSISIPTGSLVIYKAGYESKSGKVTWETSFAQAGTDTRAFLESVNSSAQTYQPLVWDLVGFPQDMPLARLLTPLGADASKSVTRSWNGHWETLTAGATLKKGRGYVLGATLPLRPALDASLPFQLRADTVVLDTGWQLVSNPLPVPVADGSIDLDSSSVSYFHSVQWQGTGKDAKYTWVISDTLQPFKGYAVHSSKPGRLIFNPLKGLAPLAKVVAVDRLTLTLDHLPTGGRAMLYFRPGASVRAFRGVGFLQPEFQAAWRRPDGSMVQGDSLQSDLILKSPLSGPVTLETSREAGVGKVFAMWSPGNAKMEVFQGSVQMQTETGWNTFKLFEVDPGQIPLIEKQLQTLGQGRFEILSLGRTFAGNGVRLSFLVPGRYSIAPILRIQVLDVMGRKVDEMTTGPLMPGTQTLDLSNAKWSHGLLFLRLSLVGGRSGESISTRFLNAGGGL